MTSPPAYFVPEYFVAVPFYSNLEYLRQTLASVIAQTDQRWRAIVVDDSPHEQGVHALVRSFDDSRLSSIRNPRNLGVAGSFNMCFDIAIQHGAELAMILHADDLLEPQYIATIRAAHRASPDATCVAPRVTVIGPDGRPRRTVPDTVKAWLWPRHVAALSGERGLQLLLRGQFFYCPAVSYRMAKVTELGAPVWTERWTQVMDLDLYARIIVAGGSIALEPSTVFRYRRHEQSMTQVSSKTMVRTVEESEICRTLAAQASALGWRRAARAGQVRVTVRLQALMRVGMLAARGKLRAAGRALALSVCR